MSTQDFRPPHEERRPMHSGDALTDYDKFLICMNALSRIAGYTGAALDMEDNPPFTVTMLTTIRKHALEGLIESGVTIAGLEAKRAAMEGMGCKL